MNSIKRHHVKHRRFSNSYQSILTNQCRSTQVTKIRWEDGWDYLWTNCWHTMFSIFIFIFIQKGHHNIYYQNCHLWKTMDPDPQLETYDFLLKRNVWADFYIKNPSPWNPTISAQEDWIPFIKDVLPIFFTLLTSLHSSNKVSTQWL